MQHTENAEQTEHELVADIQALGSRIAAAQHIHLVKVRALERCMKPSLCTFPQYIAWLCHLELKTAYELIRVAKALESLPELDRLFAEGRLSYSKIRVVTRIATPETAAVYALHAVNCTVRELEILVREHRRALPAEAKLQSDRRYLRISEDQDGGFVLRARLTAEQGAIVLKALEAAMNAGGEATREQACVDALTELATAALGQLATGDAAALRILHSENGPCAVEGHAVAPHGAEQRTCSHRRRPTTQQMRELKRVHHGVCSHPQCNHRSFLHAEVAPIWWTPRRTKNALGSPSENKAKIFHTAVQDRSHSALRLRWPLDSSSLSPRRRGMCSGLGGSRFRG